MKNSNFLSKAFVAIVAMLSIGLSAFAHDFQVNGIYFNYLDKTAKTVEVTYKGSSYSSYYNEYTGAVTIPSSVTYNSTTYSVTEIGDSAFYNCNRLTSVTIPNSVTEIGDYAFFSCDGLTSVTIPNSVTEIGNGAFYACKGLTSITIPNSVTKVGNYAFYGCSGLKELIIEDGTETLSLGYNEYDFYDGKGLFYDCPIEKLYLGRNLSYYTGSRYGYSPFYNCDELTSVTIGNSVTEIGKSAFIDCSGLTSVTIPNSVTSIGDYAFEYCYGLTSVTIPNSVTSIGDYAFFSCDGLTSVTIPNSVTEIGNGAFYACKGLTSIVVENGNSKYDSRNNCNAIVESSTNSLIIGCKNTTIPNSVTSIRDSAFEGCTGLTSITIPNSVTSIGYEAFYGCSGLTTIVVESGNSVYDSRDNCNAIVKSSTNSLIIGCKNTTIPNSVTTIGDSAFEGCTGLTSITIPNSVTVIGEMAFSLCSGLTEVNISDLSAWCKIDFGNSAANPLSYAKKLKLNGTVITNLVIPNDITQIKDCAFYNCKGMTSVTIPNSVTRIGNYAFRGCSGLTSVTIPNSVTSIGNEAFYNCTGLKELIIEDGTETLSLGYNEYGYYSTGKGLFYDCPIEKLYLGRNLSYNTGYDYGYSPFYRKTSLKSVTIGNTVTEIGDYAFYNCKGMTSISIPNSVTEIGNEAFYDCDLKSVTSYCMTPPRCCSDTFWGSYSAILKVPEGTKDLYANATVWEDFYNIQEIAGVEDVLIDNVVVKIAVENGNISINGIENPHIEIYNINGKCIYSGNDTTIPVSDTGVYILRINGKSYKIVNK